VVLFPLGGAALAEVLGEFLSDLGQGGRERILLKHTTRHHENYSSGLKLWEGYQAFWPPLIWVHPPTPLHPTPIIEYYYIFEMLKKKIWANFPRIIEVFTQKNVTELSKYGFRIRDPEKNLFRIPGSKRVRIPDPGSATLYSSFQFLGLKQAITVKSFEKYLYTLILGLQWLFRRVSK
jgi:hypothetical protein